MDRITLNSDLCCDALVIPGSAVERCLREANEAQLKIYLYLLKFGAMGDVDVSSIADYFNYTEQDVRRALRFWNGKSKSTAQEAKGDNVVAFKQRPLYTKEKLAEFAQIPEVSQLLFVAEQYLGKTLKPDDISSLLYIYDEMGFSAELIEYLLEYSISNNKKTLRSMEEVASEWKEAGVGSVMDAKRLTGSIPPEMKEVLNAFGIGKDHQPIEAEIAYVRKWTKSFGYSVEIIKEACNRTVIATGKPSFRYANSILKGWHDGGVASISDIISADEKFREGQIKASEQGKKSTSKAAPKTGGASSKFSNFNERNYDYQSLMKDILSN